MRLSKKLLNTIGERQNPAKIQKATSTRRSAIETDTDVQPNWLEVRHMNSIPPTRQCSHCKKPFTPKNRSKKTKYCNLQCAGAARATPDRSCETCGSIYHPRKPTSKYCSLACCAAAKNTPDDRSCEVCGSIYHSYKPTSKYCSLACCLVFRRKTYYRRCKRCNKPFPFEAKKKKKRFCSPACAWESLRIHHPYPGKAGTTKRGIHYYPDGGSRINNLYLRDGPVLGHKTRAVHRVMIDKYIGRPLTDNECVVHLNGDRGDNRIDNYYVFPTISALNIAMKNGRFPNKSNVHQLIKQNHD